MKFDAKTAATLRDVMRWRRDVRHFRTDPIPEDVIRRLEASLALAPSVGNARPWRIIRVEDRTLRASVRETFETCNADAADSYEGEQAQLYRDLKLSGLDRAPLQLAVFTDCAPITGHGLGRRTMPETLQQSTVMAIHTLWLAARAENVGLGMVSILEPQRIEALFDVSATWRFAAYLCLGWPEGDDDTPLLDRAGWQENIATPWDVR